MKKIRIALVVDTDGWAFSNIAGQLQAELAEEADVEIFSVAALGLPGVLLATREADLTHFFWRIHWLEAHSESTAQALWALGVDSKDFMSRYVRRVAVTSAVHDHLFLDESDIRSRVAKAMRSLVSYSVTSERLWRLYRRSGDYPTPGAVLEDGVDLTLFQPRRLERFEEYDRPLIVGWAGNSAWSSDVEDYKGVHSILRPAVDELLAEGASIQLVVADRQLGFVPLNEMPKFYAGIDVYVCASKIEGTPGPILESMACGVPVVTIDVGVVPELFGPLQREFILPERTVAALKEALRRLLANRKLLQTLSQENLRAILGWAWPHKARRYAHFFENALALQRQRNADEPDTRSGDLPKCTEGGGNQCSAQQATPVITADWLKANLVVCMLFYNKLEQTIESAESFVASGAHINLINNGSEQGAVDSMRTHFAGNPLVTIVDAGGNLGVSGGRNRQLAFTSEPWLLFVDNDISIATPDWLERMARAMRENPGVEILVPRLFNKHESAWGHMSDFVLDEAGNCAFVPTDSEFANAFPGGGSLIARSVFERHGQYDEEIFVGFEDFELAIRAWRQGSPLLSRHVPDIVLIHDHRVSQAEADKQTARVRYDAGHIGHSHLVVQRKHGVLLDPNFGDWLKEQVRQLTGESADGMVSDHVPHSLSGPTTRPRQCGAAVRLTVLLDSAAPDAWFSLRSVHLAAKHAEAAGVVVRIRITGEAPHALIDRAVHAGLLAADQPNAVEALADLSGVDVGDGLCCLSEGLMSSEFLLQVAQRLRFDGDRGQRAYVPERVIAVESAGAGAQLMQGKAFDLLASGCLGYRQPLIAIASSLIGRLLKGAPENLSDAIQEGLCRLAADGCHAFGVPESAAVIACNLPTVQQYQRLASMLPPPPAVLGYPTWLHLEQANLQAIAIYQDIAASEWPTLPLGAIRQDAVASPVLHAVLDRMLDVGIRFVMIVPWLKRGGADRATLAYLHALSEEAPGQVLLVTTEPSDSQWRSRVPDCVLVLDWAAVTPWATLDFAVASLFWLLTRMSVETVHVMNSSIGWELLATHGRQLRAFSRTFASLFWYGPSSSKRLRGYAPEFVPRVEAAAGVDTYITDNSAFSRELALQYGMGEHRFSCVWHPTTHIASAVPLQRVIQSATILWASRFAPEKRLDLLLEIATLCPSDQFMVFGDGEHSNPSTLDQLAQLKALPNVQMRGGFDDFHNLPIADCDLFLYTSSSDGMPNVLVEAMAHGLPVVASIVGGVGGLVDDQTGWPVHRANNPQAYAEEIRRAMSETAERRDRASHALARVRERHHPSSFKAQLRAVTGYIQPA